MRAVFTLLLISVSMVWAQSTANKLDAYIAQLDRLDAEAKTAFDREMARDEASRKNGECADASNTRASEDCLSKEIGITGANLKAFTGAIRSILALDAPGDEQPVSGATGMPLTREQRVKQFDDVEAAWETFRKAQTSAAYDQWKGGTIAPVESATCDLMLMRSRMRELNSIYDAQLRHH